MSLKNPPSVPHNTKQEFNGLHILFRDKEKSRHTPAATAAPACLSDV